MPTPWLHQDTTTITLYGAYEEEFRLGAGPVPPRPAYGQSQEGHDDLKQVLLSLGVSSDGLPLRLGVRDGHTTHVQGVRLNRTIFAREERATRVGNGTAL